MRTKSLRRTAAPAVIALACLGWLPGSTAAAGRSCEAPLPQDGEPVTLDPVDFSGTIDNPYWPMTPGSTWISRESDPSGGRARVRVYVTNRTKQIDGIAATVVHDVVREDGEIIENTWDWYAQDVCGNVWYLGENTKEYENGVVVSTEGSWEAGVNGAQAGVVVPAEPAVGLTYRQEYFAGEAEDQASVLSLDEQAQTPAGYFADVLLTKEFTPLHLKILEYKLFAKGVGPVLAFGVSGGSGIEELMRFDIS
jgi:hypothetical protein